MPTEREHEPMSEERLREIEQWRIVRDGMPVHDMDRWRAVRLVKATEYLDDLLAEVRRLQAENAGLKDTSAMLLAATDEADQLESQLRASQAAATEESKHADELQAKLAERESEIVLHLKDLVTARQGRDRAEQAARELRAALQLEHEQGWGDQEVPLHPVLDSTAWLDQPESEERPCEPSYPIDEDTARELLQAEENCFSEGLEGVPAKLLLFIREHHPKIANEFNCLPWDRY